MSGWGRKSTAAPVSFAAGDRGLAQPVLAMVCGVEYPGEIVVAGGWDATLGEELTRDSMFRVVLLDSTQAPHPGEIRDARIGVAVLASRAGLAARGVSGLPEGSLEAEVSSLRAARQRLLSAPGQERRDLASTISERERRAQRDLAQESLARWAGASWTFSSAGPPGVGGEGLGVPQAGDDWHVWLGAAARVLLQRAGVLPDETGQPALDSRGQAMVWDDIADGRIPRALGVIEPRFARLTGTGALDELDRLLEMHRGEVFQSALRKRLVHELGIPPAVAALCIASHLAARDSEVVLTTPAAGSWADHRPPDPPRLIRDQLPGARCIHDLLDRTGSLRAKVTCDWDSALQYVRVVMPAARMAGDGGGGPDDQEAFVRLLQELAGRFRLGMGVSTKMKDLFEDAGLWTATDSQKLVDVLSAGSWREYFLQVRAEYRGVEYFRKAYDSARKMYRAGAERVLQLLRERNPMHVTAGVPADDLHVFLKHFLRGVPTRMERMDS